MATLNSHKLGTGNEQSIPQKRGHGATRSVGEADDENVVDLLLGNVAKALEVQPLPHYHEVVEATKVVKSARSIVRLVIELKKKKGNENFKVQALSFSRVDLSHYKILGIVCPPDKYLKQANLQPAVIALWSDISTPYYTGTNAEPLLIIRCVELFWEEIKVNFLEDLEDTLKTTGHHTEARSRMIIDLWIQKLTRLILRRLKGGILLYPEMQISNSGSDHVEIRSGQNLTVLTGSVDYALFTSKKPLLPAGASDILAAVNLESVQASLALRKIVLGNAMQIFLIEAKKHMGKLSTFEPQVIAECIASMKKLNAVSMAWCLTNGVEWMFGVVEDKGGSILVHRAEVVAYQTAELQSQEADLQYIFTLLVCWATTTAENLLKLF